LKLQIRYKENGHAPVHAACIRGKDPLIWLNQIDRWNIPPGELECYLLPASIQSIQAVALFVIFKDPVKAKALELSDPYTCVEHRLFIPCNAEIMPQVSRHEWRDILLWDKQVFHPIIGLIGFEPKDQIDLAELFLYDAPGVLDWSFAHPGIPSKPGLKEIIIAKQTTEELINSVKKEIGLKPLEDIPKTKEDEPSALGKILDTIKYGLFKGASVVLGAISNTLPEGNAGSEASGKGGFFQKLNDWLVRNLDELQKKRNDEIKRLLNLFDTNSNEALEYAIPLHSAYLNRGSQTVSTSLERRSTRFSLGNLGGGDVVDAWDLGDYYQDLRIKYLNAAQKAIENKDFKKAAYVYAHLLSDYSSAANTLEQGKMYREAAVLYKDHLKNMAAAAECLERGGLYLEAIELNKELVKYEKTGDLYKLINQEQSAEIYYEKHIEAKLSHNDHLDAARVIDEKLEQKERAQQVLLEGWGHSYQHESCLKKYFDLVLATEPDTAAVKVKGIFEKSTPKHKRLPLLNVLEYLNGKKDDEALTETTKEIVYEIVHEEAESGNTQVVHNLKNFLPGDKLISGDTSRYVSQKPAKSVRSLTQDSFYLDQSIKWVAAVWHRNQFLAAGIKDSCLHMARGNWYGKLEYSSWTNAVKLHTRFTFVNAPYYSNSILLHSSAGLPVTRKNLPKNKYFNESLVVYCPVWLHHGTAQFIVDEDSNICRLDIENEAMTLHQYTADGELKKSVNCSFEGDMPPLGSMRSNPLLAKHNGFYYTYRENYFITVSDNGVAKGYAFDTLIRFFSASLSFTDFRIIVSTNKGCLLYKPSGLDLNMQGGFFAERMIPSFISFVQSDRFIIAEKMKASLFEIKDEMPHMVREYETHTAIIAALPTSTRSQFALLEVSGKITICEMDA
jgi:hypothetical protein